MVDILDNINKKHLADFSKDFDELIRVAYGMEKAYKNATEKIKSSQYSSLISLFNKKYRGLKVNMVKTTEELKTTILLDEKSLKDLFTNVATKISGLKAIGTDNFDEVYLKDTDRFSAKAAQIKDALFLTYSYSESEDDSFLLKAASQMVELSYNFDILRDEHSAEFKVCAFYALKEDVDVDIDFGSVASSFGFVDLMDDKELKSFKDKFDPRMLE